MGIRLTDAEIAALLAEGKWLTAKQHAQLSRLRINRDLQMRSAVLNVKGSEGTRFQIIIRQSMINRLDFSVILAFKPRGSNEVFRLRRYNGKHPPYGRHRNRIEGKWVEGFHIHTATLRYQDLGMHEDTFAEATSRFQDLTGAVRCLLADCHVTVERGLQGELPMS